MGKKAKSLRALKRKQAKKALKEQRRQLYASYALQGKAKGQTGQRRSATAVTRTAKRTNHHPGWRKGVQAKRREQAEKRQAERAKRTPVQQIDHLNSILGVNIGAKKERAKLHEQILAQTSKKNSP